MVSFVDVNLLGHTGKVVDQQIGIAGQGTLISPPRQLLFDCSLEEIDEEGIVVESRIADWETIGRSPGVGEIVAESDVTLDV
jgi:hypothetical protein